MKKVIFSVGLTFILGIGLSACNPSVDAFDYASPLPPTANVDQSTLGVGEPVEVTLITDFELPGPSRVPQRTVRGIVLGTCFGTDVTQSNNLSNAQGYCDPNEDDSPPPWISVVGNTSHVSALPDIIVERGQKVVVKHTFSFTRTEPGEVVLAPHIYFTSEGDGPGWVGGMYSTVTFE